MMSDALEILEKMLPPPSSKARQFSEPHYRAVRDEILTLRKRVRDCEGAIERREQFIAEANTERDSAKDAEVVAWAELDQARKLITELVEYAECNDPGNPHIGRAKGFLSGGDL